MIRLTVVLMLLQFSSHLLAQSSSNMRLGLKKDGIPSGLEVGEVAPEFTLTNYKGNSQSLSEMITEHYAIIIFYRGHWCPSCNRYLSYYQDSLQLIEDAGGKLVAITPELPENETTTIENTGVRFDILHDADNEVMRQYDVLFEVNGTYNSAVKIGKGKGIAANNGQDKAMLPVPATYIVNHEGIIVYRHFDIDYRKRASVKDMLKAISESNSERTN